MMRRIALLLLPAAVLLAVACGGDQAAKTDLGGSQPPAASIQWGDAINHVGEQGTVCGPVLDSNYASSSNGQPTFLNLGKSYPDPDRFTVLIWGSNRGKFSPPPEKAYAGRTICATGLIQSYAGAAEIEAKAPGDIKVVQ
jgi:hypothetical protein